MDKIAVLIPCLNEAKTIKKVIEDFHRELPEATIYVYDNNSTDGTDEIAKEAGAIVRYEKKQGKGNVICSMFKDIDAKCYIITDGDDTYPSEYARKMCEEVLENDVDMVIGDRLSSTYFKENKRPFHSLGNKIVKRMINSLFDSDIKDIMTGYRAFSYRFVKTFPADSHGFEIETEMTIHSLDKGLSISNVVVDYRNRPDGSKSKVSTIKDGAKITKTIFKLYKKYKPFKFYSLFAMILTFVGLILSIFGIKEYMDNGYITNKMIILMPTIFYAAALLIILMASILEIINDKKKTNFSLKLKQYADEIKNVKNKEL